MLTLAYDIDRRYPNHDLIKLPDSTPGYTIELDCEVYTGGEVDSLLYLLSIVAEYYSGDVWGGKLCSSTTVITNHELFLHYANDATSNPYLEGTPLRYEVDEESVRGDSLTVWKSIG
jgi:hypothetical protein